MKTPIAAIVALLALTPLLRSESAVRPVGIHFTFMSEDGKKQLIVPLLIVNDSTEGRVCIDSEDFEGIDVAVTPKIEGDRVHLSIRIFTQDEDGKQRVISVPTIVSTFDKAAEVKVDNLGFRVVSTLDVLRPLTKKDG